MGHLHRAVTLIIALSIIFLGFSHQVRAAERNSLEPWPYSEVLLSRDVARLVIKYLPLSLQFEVGGQVGGQVSGQPNGKSFYHDLFYSDQQIDTLAAVLVRLLKTSDVSEDQRSTMLQILRVIRTQVFQLHYEAEWRPFEALVKSNFEPIATAQGTQGQSMINALTAAEIAEIEPEFARASKFTSADLLFLQPLRADHPLNGQSTASLMKLDSAHRRRALSGSAARAARERRQDYQLTEDELLQDQRGQDRHPRRELRQFISDRYREQVEYLSRNEVALPLEVFKPWSMARALIHPAMLAIAFRPGQIDAPIAQRDNGILGVTIGALSHRDRGERVLLRGMLTLHEKSMEPYLAQVRRWEHWLNQLSVNDRDWLAAALRHRVQRQNWQRETGRAISHKYTDQYIKEARESLDFFERQLVSKFPELGQPTPFSNATVLLSHPVRGEGLSLQYPVGTVYLALNSKYGEKSWLRVLLEDLPQRLSHVATANSARYSFQETLQELAFLGLTLAHITPNNAALIYDHDRTLFKAAGLTGSAHITHSSMDICAPQFRSF